MFAYKFKITFEDQDGFERYVEIGTDQTFLDFYHIMAENLGLDRSKAASFYLCDHRFRKRQEIRLSEPPKQEPVATEEGETPVPRTLHMKGTEISELVDDPHQKFVLVYDEAFNWTFFIELIKILQADAKASLPAIVKTLGPVPIEISRKMPVLPGLDDSDDDDLLDEEQGPLSLLDDEGEGDFYEEDEMNDFGEEGEDTTEAEEVDDASFYDDSIEIPEDFEDPKF